MRGEAPFSLSSIVDREGGNGCILSVRGREREKEKERQRDGGVKGEREGGNESLLLLEQVVTKFECNIPYIPLPQQ